MFQFLNKKTFIVIISITQLFYAQDLGGQSEELNRGVKKELITLIEKQSLGFNGIVFFNSVKYEFRIGNAKTVNKVGPAQLFNCVV